MGDVGQLAFHQHLHLLARQAGKRVVGFGQEKSGIHLALDGQARSGLVVFHQMPLDVRLFQISHFQQAQADELDVAVVREGNGAAGLEVARRFVGRVGASGDHHFVRLGDGARDGLVASIANHGSRVKRIGVHAIDFAGGNQLGLLGGRSGRHQMDVNARFFLQQRVEHVPARKAFRREVGSNQQVQRHAWPPFSSASIFLYRAVISSIFLREGSRRTEV